MQIPTLTDGVVTLRGPREDDVEGSYEQCQDPLSQEWTTVPVPYSRDDARSFVLGSIPRGWESDTEWAFVVEVEGRYAGVISLRDRGQARAEVAYGSHPWVRGTGHVERALRLLLEWGFAERDLRTVIWWADRGNWASRKLAWRLGFTVEGTVRQWLTQRGSLRDGWVGTLLHDDPREPRTTWLTVPELEGDGVRLRPHREADLPRMVEARADAETAYWLGRTPVPYDEQHARALLASMTERLATGQEISWAVTEEDDVYLGTVDAFDLAPGEALEVGYLLHPDARGRGVATRAVRRLLQHAFDDLGVQHVSATAAVTNEASRRLLERCGFVHTGTERRGTTLRDGRADAARYDVLAEEWRGRA